MCSSVGQIQGDLAARLASNSLMTEPDAWDEAEDDGESDASSEDDPHPALRTLLELDAGAPGSVSPRLAAAICDHDRDLVLDLLTWLHAHELARTDEITALLRAALRVVVDEAAARWDREPPSRSGGASLPTKPRRRRPDATREDADPDIRKR